MQTNVLMSIIVSTCTIFVSTYAPPAKSLTTDARFEIPRTAVHTIPSKNLGRSYQIYVKTPSGYEKKENSGRRYPTIYLNDGPYTFQVASGVTRLPMNTKKIEDAILVGISFAEGENGMASRVRDLTPTIAKDWKKYKTGGAKAYLNFIEKQVFPFVENAYRADASRRTLSGQSLGGSFGAWVLLSKPELFASYVLTSPSLWFDNRMIFELEKQYASKHKELKARVYFATGGLETMRDGMFHEMVQDQNAFVARLKSRRYPGLVIKDEVIDGALHETTFPIGFTRGVQWLFHRPAATAQ